MRAAPVSAARKLHRRAERAATGRFLVEGRRAVGEALAEHARRGDVVHELFVTADLAAESSIGAAAEQAGVPVHVVAEHVAEVLAGTRTPQGVVAVCAMPRQSAADALRGGVRLVCVLVGAADPGNAGTAIRTADAVGADAVVLAGSSVDAYNGKCVRATAGSIFHLPVITADEPADLIEALHRQGLVVYAADAHGTRTLDDLEASQALAAPTAWVFGNEAHGLCDGVRALVDETVRATMYGRAESLNLAATVAICLYATAKLQRRD